MEAKLDLAFGIRSRREGSLTTHGNGVGAQNYRCSRAIRRDLRPMAEAAGGIHSHSIVYII
jgi:hypothetical protein